AIDLGDRGANAQRPGGMAETHHVARTATGGAIYEGAGHSGRGGDRDRGRAHHRVVQLAHRHRAHVEVDVAGGDLPATAGKVIARWRHEGDLGRVLAPGSLFRRG